MQDVISPDPRRISFVPVIKSCDGGGYIFLQFPPLIYHQIRPLFEMYFSNILTLFTLFFSNLTRMNKNYVQC